MQPHVLEWLTKLKRLKTVGVLSTNGCTYCDKCLPKLLRLSRTLEKVVIWTLFEDDDEAIEYDEEQIKSYWMLRAGALALMAAEEEMKEIGESTVPLARYEALLPAIEEELIHERKVCLFGSLLHPTLRVISFFLFTLKTFRNAQLTRDYHLGVGCLRG